MTNLDVIAVLFTAVFTAIYFRKGISKDAALRLSETCLAMMLVIAAVTYFKGL